MAHFPKPFFRPARALWYVQIDGKQINLGADKAEAFKAYHGLMQQRADAKPEHPAPVPGLRRLVVVIIDEYLDWCQRNRAPATYGIYPSRERNSAATKIIQDYARKHAAVDAAIGLAGFLPIPGAAAMSILASLTAQIPLYKSLARKLSIVYELPQDQFSKAIVNSNMALDTGFTVAADVGTDLAMQFGSDFLTDVIGELLGEIGIGVGVSFIPILGGFVSMGLDVAIAVTMSWRVGVMVSMYHQNGRRWIDSREETFSRASRLTGGVSPSNEGRVGPAADEHRSARYRPHILL